MIGPPNFPSYNLSTCNLPHQRPQPFRFSHLLPSPSQLCDKPQSFSRDFFTSKQSRKTKAHPVSVPFQSGQSPSTHPPASFATPFPKTNSPRPRRHRPGLVARRVSPCIIVVIATWRLCPSHAPICPPYTATPCPMPHPSPDGGPLRLKGLGKGICAGSAQRRLLGSPAWPTRATPPLSGEPPF